MRDYTVKACETEKCLVRLALICRKKKKLEKKRSDTMLLPSSQRGQSVRNVKILYATAALPNI